MVQSSRLLALHKLGVSARSWDTARALGRAEHRTHGGGGARRVHQWRWTGLLEKTLQDVRGCAGGGRSSEKSAEWTKPVCLHSTGTLFAEALVKIDPDETPSYRYAAQYGFRATPADRHHTRHIVCFAQTQIVHKLRHMLKDAKPQLAAMSMSDCRAPSRSQRPRAGAGASPRA